jgi:single-strand DNA-binding protein
MSTKVELLGHIGNDVELKKPNEKVTIVEMSIATKESWKDAEGKDKEQTDWHNVKFYGKSAEEAAKFAKGNFVNVSGKLKYDEYEDKQGSKQKRAYIHGFAITPYEKK